MAAPAAEKTEKPPKEKRDPAVYRVFDAAKLDDAEIASVQGYNANAAFTKLASERPDLVGRLVVMVPQRNATYASAEVEQTPRFKVNLHKQD